MTLKTPPTSVEESSLWRRISDDPQLSHSLLQLRSNAAIVGAKVSELVPGFTDHSVNHMDALWGVADMVFTSTEVAEFSVAEAFILGSAFYTHDLGMALAATPSGRQALKESAAYRSVFARLASKPGLDVARAECVALQVAARETHASQAETLIDDLIPGIDRYLLEAKELRDQWGDHIGKVAASHHWTLRQVDERLGSAGRLPAPNGEAVDLGFLACALRIIDYSHINAARAPQLERLLRAEMSDESLVHWLAQEFISGPTRDGQYLAYASMRPLSDVDAWWVFFEMATGLDREITAVADYLSERTVSAGRFSLEGVKGVKSPTTFAKYVRPGGFSPVDIRFRPDSMTRLVDLLGGKQLYGNDRFAALRELLQNARDAIHLQRAIEQAAGQEPRPGIIDVRLDGGSSGARLSVSDDGVGMSAKTVTTYLLGIASDYWHSQDFINEYPAALNTGFSAVGRFGIGFLSVFMLGEDVEVETQRIAGANLSLRLRGVGKRGALQERPSALRTGTTVRIAIPNEKQPDFEGLARIVQAKAPMLDIRVRVSEMDTTSHVEPGWWKHASQDEITAFLARRDATAKIPLREQRRIAAKTINSAYERRYLRRLLLSETSSTEKWPGRQPEVITDAYRVIATPGRGTVVLCSKGFAIDELAVSGLTGLAEVGEIEINAARSRPLGFDEESFRHRMLVALWPHVVAATDRLADEGGIPARFPFLRILASVFGGRILKDTTLPWIGVQELRGNTVLISSAELYRRVKSSNEVFVAYGTGPWTADHWVRSFHSDVGSGYLLIVVPTAGGPSVRSRYGQDQGRIDAPLPAHFVPDHVEADDAQSQIASAHLLTEVLSTVAAAWDVPTDSLYAEGWSRNQTNLIGRLRHQ